MKKEQFKSEFRAACPSIQHRPRGRDEGPVPDGPDTTLTAALSAAEPRLEWIEPVKNETAFLCKRW